MALRRKVHAVEADQGYEEVMQHPCGGEIDRLRSLIDACEWRDSAPKPDERRLTQAAMALPEVRMEKVCAMQKLLQKSHYRVSASEVASAVLRGEIPKGSQAPWQVESQDWDGQAGEK